MYDCPVEWFARNYTIPKGLYSLNWDRKAPNGLEAQYGRLVTDTLTPHEYDYYRGIKSSFCGYLGEILLSGALNWYIGMYYPQTGLNARLSTWEEDDEEKIDVVISFDHSPSQRLGIQAKLSKNCQSRVYGCVPVIGLKLGDMNLGMEDLMNLHAGNPQYLISPDRFINERFNYDADQAVGFMDALMQQTGRVLRRTGFADVEENHPLGGVFRALCGYSF